MTSNFNLFVFFTPKSNFKRVTPLVEKGYSDKKKDFCELRQLSIVWKKLFGVQRSASVCSSVTNSRKKSYTKNVEKKSSPASAALSFVVLMLNEKKKEISRVRYLMSTITNVSASFLSFVQVSGRRRGG